MNTFKLLIKLGTPVVIKGFAPSLDGILYQAIKNRFPEKNHEQTLGFLRKILAFDEEKGVFHASCMRFGFTEVQGISAKFHVRNDRAAHYHLFSEYFMPNSTKGKYKKVVSIGGPYKKRLDKYQSYAAPYAIFNGKGNADAVVSLIENCLNGIGYDANNCSTGALMSVVAIETEQDESFYLADGSLNKYLPALNENTDITNRIVPPYYLGEGRVKVLAPDAVRAEFVTF